MNDLISRGAFESDLRNYADRKNANGENSLANGILSAVNRLKYAPAVDAAPVVHGRWILDMHGQATMVCHCSICGCQKALIDGNYTMFKYCSDCGSKMDGKEEVLMSRQDYDKLKETGFVRVVKDDSK